MPAVLYTNMPYACGLQVVVWASVAFGNKPKGSSVSPAGGAHDVHSVCSKMEASGLSIKRCDTAEQAIEKARDLHREGQLRCVIVGGGEGSQRHQTAVSTNCV